MFRKKPVIIEADQFGGPPGVQAGTMFMEYPVKMDNKTGMPYIEIPTKEGVMRADFGDWIITGIKGERYPRKPDIFEATYEAVKVSKEK